MDYLEKKLTSLPKVKLSRQADLKIIIKLYSLIISEKISVIWSFNFFNHKALGRTVLVTGLMIVTLMLTAVYAYASDAVLPASPLYQLKRVVEKLEEKISFSTDAKLDTYAKFSERRLQEVLVLSQQDMPSNATDRHNLNQQIQEGLNEATTNIDSMANQVQSIANQNSHNIIATKFKEKTTPANDYLKQIEDQAQINHDQEVIIKVDEIKQNIEQYQVILDENSQKNKQPNNANTDYSPEVENTGTVIEQLKPSKNLQPSSAPPNKQRDRQIDNSINNPGKNQ